MPIEFRCTQCNRLLRTQDETAGKKAKCPECGTILTIPAPAGPPVTTPPTPAAPTPSPAGPPPLVGGPESPFGPIEPPAPGAASPFGAGTAAEAENPYASPADYTLGAPAAYAPAGGRVVPTRIDMGETFGRTWRVFKAQLGISLAVFVISLILTMVVPFALGFVGGLVGAAAQNPAVEFIISFFVQVVSWLFNTWIGIGVAICFLKVARGQEVNLGEIFAGGPYFLTVLLASIVFGLILGGVVLACLLVAGILGGIVAAVQGEPGAILVAIIGGYVVAAVPAIILAMMFSMYQYLIIDRHAGIIESLTLSKQITTGNKGTMFVMLFVAGLLGGLLVLFTCFLGIFLVGPYMAVLWVVMYLSMSGQLTLDQLQAGPRMV